MYATIRVPTKILTSTGLVPSFLDKIVGFLETATPGLRGTGQSFALHHVQVYMIAAMAGASELEQAIAATHDIYDQQPSVAEALHVGVSPSLTSISRRSSPLPLPSPSTLSSGTQA